MWESFIQYRQLFLACCKMYEIIKGSMIYLSNMTVNNNDVFLTGKILLYRIANMIQICQRLL